MFKEYLVFYFPARAYNKIDVLAEKMTNPICRSSTVNYSLWGNEGLGNIYRYWCPSRFPCSYDYLGNVHEWILNLGFDVTPDRKVDEEYISLPRQGNIRIVVC
jgi:hypothetical protein